jgi:hypothetical protein
MPLDQSTRQKIETIFRQFLQNRADTIRRLKIEDLNINPFLIRILSFEMRLDNPESIIRWLVHQRLERGTVTSFGIALQEAAKAFSEGTGVEGADIMKTREGRRYYIQVKSGPNTIPKDLGVRIAQLLRSAQRRNQGSAVLYGMCYGSEQQVSSIVRRYVDQEGQVPWLTGRRFWEFISEDPTCIDEIYAIVGEVARTFRDSQGQTLSEILEAKVQELTRRFVELYGENGDEMWENLLRYNS